MVFFQEPKGRLGKDARYRFQLRENNRKYSLDVVLDGRYLVHKLPLLLYKSLSSVK